MRIIYDKFVILLLFSVFAIGFGLIISFLNDPVILTLTSYLFENCTVKEFMVFYSRNGLRLEYFVFKEARIL
jgi:hypothetical protein